MKGKALLLEAATQGIPEPLNIPLVAAWVVGEELVLAGELVVLGTEEKNAINDECEEDNHRAVVHDVVAPRIDTTVSSRASQSSLDAHDANLTTRADAIDAKLVVIDGKLDVIGANIDEILAREIEERLAASSCLHIVSLYLPAANGGRLETVRDIVGGLITDQTNAGLGVGSAQVRFDKGIDLLGDDSFKEAYKEFCSAYRQLLSAR